MNQNRILTHTLPGLAGMARTPSHRFAVGYDLPSLRDSGKIIKFGFFSESTGR
jgi:hypothetical protein